MSNKTIAKKNHEHSLFSNAVGNFLKPWDSWFNNYTWERALTIPAVNISEDDKNYKLSVAAPGLDKSDFKVDVKGNLLTISAEKEASSEEKGSHFNRQEYNYSSFSRTFTMPEGVKQDEIEAEYKDGLLHLTLPKNAAAAKNTKSIKIR